MAASVGSGAGLLRVSTAAGGRGSAALSSATISKLWTRGVTRARSTAVLSEPSRKAKASLVPGRHYHHHHHRHQIAQHGHFLRRQRLQRYMASGAGSSGKGDDDEGDDTDEGEVEDANPDDDTPKSLEEQAQLFMGIASDVLDPQNKKAAAGGEDDGNVEGAADDDDADDNGGGADDADADADAKELATAGGTAGEENQPLSGFPFHIPDEVPELLVLPIDGNPVFPKFYKFITTSDRKLANKLELLSKTNQPWCGAFLRRDATDDEGGAGTTGSSTVGGPTAASSSTASSTSDDGIGIDDVHEIGAFCAVNRMEHDAGTKEWKFLVQGIRRVQITGVKEDEEILTATVENAHDLDFDKENKRIRAYHAEILRTLRELVKYDNLYRESVQQVMQESNSDMGHPSVLADFIAGVTHSSDGKLQGVLEELNIEKRLELALKLLKEDYLQTKLQHEISQEVEDKINKARRQHMLQEQLKIIKRELGITKDDKDAVSEKFKARLEGLAVPEEAREVIDEELNKLNFLDQNSSEFNVTRNYLDWLTAIPWGKTTEDNFDMPNALQVLDEDHYGMKDAKDRILEFIAVGKLKGEVQGKILCLSGPPGVGKTSIAKSIARALSREYFRFSVGGLHDVAEIKGHRRTYVGAMPGKFIQALKRTESENPLILIDEIDKLGRGHTGDPSSALLEALDPEQNKNYLDHYLDVPIDLSKVLFLCTANTLDTIPGPLLDRMEVIELSGYMLDEKVAISENYLLPAEAKNAGVEDRDVSISTEALSQLIKGYARESGVRNLQKKIEKIYRKAAVQLVRDGADAVQVTEDNLQEFVGNPVFTSDRMYDTTPPGVVMGLAWTSMGGSALYIETIATQTGGFGGGGGGGEGTDGGVGSGVGSGSGVAFKITGNLGDVMKESASIASTFAKHFLGTVDPTNDFFFGSKQINMHVPEGATPKDGPSAGITITTAVLSLALGKPVRPDLAMTGELSLTGKVLRVGGIKEKILAAKRAAVTTIILPEGCRTDFVELPDQVKEGIDVHFVSDYAEVYKIAFGP